MHDADRVAITDADYVASENPLPRGWRQRLPTESGDGPVTSRTAYHIRNTTVHVRNPRPGDVSVYPSGSADHQRYGVVSVLPGQNNTTRLILLTGANTAALASFLASPVTLRQLDSYLAANANPAFFEMVVAAETDGMNLQKARPVAIRQISANIWKD